MLLGAKMKCYVQNSDSVVSLLYVPLLRGDNNFICRSSDAMAMK
jgi:hypothetical protein